MAPRPHPGGTRNAIALARLYSDCALEGIRQGDALAAAKWTTKALEVLDFILERDYGSPSILD